MAANIVILSSSPPRPALDRTSMSPSPGLPSPSVLIQRTISAGSPRSSELPRNAIEAFKSGTALPRDGVTQEDRTRKPKPAKMTEPANGAPVGKGKKTMKNGAVPGKTGKQTGIKQMKVTKVLRNTSISQLDGKQYASKSELTVHEHSASLSGVVNEVTSDDHGLHLSKVMRRKVNWTPPKNTPVVDLSMTPLTSPTSVENQLEESTFDSCPEKSLKDLMASFGYRQEERPSSAAVLPGPLAGNGTRKRQWTELINPPSVVAPTSGETLINRIPLEETAPVKAADNEIVSIELALSETGPEEITQEQAFKGRVARKTPRSRAPRRKPKTVTQQATRPYDTRPPSPAPVLRHLAQQRIESHKDVGVEITALKSIPPPKRSHKARADKGADKVGPTPRRKRSKESESPSVLLSPRSALEKVGEQDILFGTSSQLAEERLPTLAPLLPAPSELDIFPSESRGVKNLIGREPQKRILPYSPTGGLWSAASRGLDGALMEAEVIDLATTPKARNALGSAAKVTMPVAPDQSLRVAAAPPNRKESWAQADENKALPVCPDDHMIEATKKNQAGSGPSRAHRLQNRVPDTAVATNVSSVFRNQPTPVDSPNIRLSKPDFTGYSTSQLSSELLSYGFKPIKSRNQMIMLLEKCWEGRMSRVAPKTPGPSASMPTPEQIENSRPTGGEPLVAEGPHRPTTMKQTRQSQNTSSISIISSCGVSSKTSECGPREDLLARRKNTPSNGPGPGTTNITSPKKARGRNKKLVATGGSGSPPDDEAWGRVGGVAKIAGQGVSPGGVGRLEINDLKADVLSSVSCTPSTEDPPLGASTAPTPSLSDEAKQQRRFDHITRAIVSQAQPKDAPAMPNFHQKILMYDPIVLEDLAAWLNTKGLADIGVDAEVGAAEVRAWCEQNSVCCLWKESLWRGTRSRHG
ncbi:hypothetical protein GP486_002532 [Trichoglossum hirsutum]|uniref:Structure-specific endonuclease subunit SLX4 n=1 Tax=Trichoglossum hirsutum TaxID=265104 RepID=A0A9P8LF15_9PEZI|nr:hypothetical protein GP486_002532 [Trichoglossum hirsutum]